MRTVHLLGLMILAAGCATSAPVYDVFLENATDPVIQVFEDESIAIRFMAGRDHLGFDLRNKTNGAIEILWDDIVLKDVNGQDHAVCHSDIDFEHLDKPQMPTVVPAQQRVQHNMIPKDHISRCGGEAAKWDIDPLLLPKGSKITDTKSLSADVVGKNFNVMMPMNVGGNRKSYFFTFKVTGVSGPGGKAPTVMHGERERIQPTK